MIDLEEIIERHEGYTQRRNRFGCLKELFNTELPVKVIRDETGGKKLRRSRVVITLRMTSSYMTERTIQLF